MEDSVISFRNDETDRDANKLYRRVTRFLRKVLKQSQDTTKEEEITATMLYEVENNNSRYMKPKMKQIQRE
jgi:hypothetical protein